MFDRKLKIETDFKDKLSSGYKADLIATDFSNPRQALFDVENYLKIKSNGRLTSVITEKDLKEGQMLMASAIIFDSQWKAPFNRSLTTEQMFYDEDNNAIAPVNMMFQKNSFPYTAMKELDSYLVELPYGSGSLSMIVILPRKGVSLGKVIENLKQVSLTEMFTALYTAEVDYEGEEVDVYLPRFSVKSQLNLHPSLEAMGLLDLFQPDFASLTRMCRANTYLAQLIHNVEIKVNEEGTFASAVTIGIIGNKQSPPKFLANRPFLYLIVEKQTNTLLFIGQIQDPLTIN